MASVPQFEMPMVSSTMPLTPMGIFGSPLQKYCIFFSEIILLSKVSIIVVHFRPAVQWAIPSNIAYHDYLPMQLAEQWTSLETLWPRTSSRGQWSWGRDILVTLQPYPWYKEIYYLFIFGLRFFFSPTSVPGYSQAVTINFIV